jgi:hypothetical protein
VEVLGPVQTESDRESLGRQKAAPILVEKEAVGLKAVGKPPARGAIFALKVDDPAEIVYSKDGRFTAMPGEANGFIRRSLEMLGDISGQKIGGHSERGTFREEFVFFEIVTVVAAEFASRPCRLGENLKSPGGFGHGKSIHFILFREY